MADAKGGKPATKKYRKGVSRGIVHIKATFNNTIVTITDTNGETLSWASAGTVNFKGARKSTPFAAGRAADKAAQEAKKSGKAKDKARKDEITLPVIAESGRLRLGPVVLPGVLEPLY